MLKLAPIKCVRLQDGDRGLRSPIVFLLFLSFLPSIERRCGIEMDGGRGGRKKEEQAVNL